MYTYTRQIELITVLQTASTHIVLLGTVAFLNSVHLQWRNSTVGLQTVNNKLINDSLLQTVNTNLHRSKDDLLRWAENIMHRPDVHPPGCTVFS